MKNPDHPVWKLTNWLVLLVFVTLFAWTNASNFDETEVKMIGQLMLAMFGWDVARGYIKSGDK